MPYQVIGVGGTFTSLGAIHLDLQSYDRERVHGTTLTIDDLDALVDRLSSLTIAETGAIPSLDPKRAPSSSPERWSAAEAVRHVGNHGDGVGIRFARRNHRAVVQAVTVVLQSLPAFRKKSSPVAGWTSCPCG